MRRGAAGPGQLPVRVVAVGRRRASPWSRALPSAKFSGAPATAGHGRGPKIDRWRAAGTGFGHMRRLCRLHWQIRVGEDRFRLIGENAVLSIFTSSNPQPIREPARGGDSEAGSLILASQTAANQ